MTALQREALKINPSAEQRRRIEVLAVPVR